jgi:hypothetical protein
MNWLVRLLEDSELAGEVLIRKSINELEGQSHVASGRGIRSLKTKVEGMGFSSITIDLIGEEYLVFIDRGAKKRFPPVVRIFEWLKDKGIGGDDEERNEIAWAVSVNMSKEGTPSSSSLQYSKNGRNLEWTKFAEMESRGEIREIFSGSKWLEFLYDEVFMERT